MEWSRLLLGNCHSLVLTLDPEMCTLLGAHLKHLADISAVSVPRILGPALSTNLQKNVFPA